MEIFTAVLAITTLWPVIRCDKATHAGSGAILCRTVEPFSSLNLRMDGVNYGLNIIRNQHS